MISWKQDMADRLRLISALQAAREGIPLQLKALEAQLPEADGPCREGLTQRCDQLRQTLAQVELRLEQILQALGALNPEERLILHRFYVCRDRGWLESLCVDLGIERSSVYRRKDKALAKFALALLGRQAQ